MKINFKHEIMQNSKLGDLKRLNDKCREVRLRTKEWNVKNVIMNGRVGKKNQNPVLDVRRG